MRKLSDIVALTATVDPQLKNNGTLDSDWVKVADGAQALFILNLGATDVTIDMALQQATDSSGSGAKAITGYSLTQLGATMDNDQAMINVHKDALDPTFTYVRAHLTMSSASTGAYVSVVGLTGNLRYAPPSDYDLATVAQIV